MEKLIKCHFVIKTLSAARYDEYSKEMKTLKEKEKSLVSRGRFEGVCSELNSALDREKKAQKLLREQNAKLQVSIRFSLNLEYQT